jgi:hypothetical protein
VSIEFRVDFRHLVQRIVELRQLPEQLTKSLAQGLNKYSEELVELIVMEFARQTGQSESDARQQVSVEKRATPNDLSTEIAQDFAGLGWSSPGQVSAGTLVNIVTMDDGNDCPICQDYAARSPYSLAEIASIRKKWEHYAGHAGGDTRTNLIHPNCRCVLQPWRRRDPVTGRFVAMTGTKAIRDSVRRGLKA